MTETDKNAIKYKYALGYTIAELQRMYNISYYDVTKILHAGGEQLQRGRRAYSTTLQRAIIDDYNSGLIKVKMLANKYDVSLTYIYHVLNNAGVKFSHGNHRDKEIYQYVIEHPEKNRSDCARDLGISRQRVHQIMQLFKSREAKNGQV